MTQDRTVLVVDDEDDIREVARAALEITAGWRVLVADSGPAAVERAAAERPDAILLDVMMPGMDGPATLGKLREAEATRNVPVVMLTAKTQAADRIRLAELGTAGVIDKPFDPVTLAGRIEELLGWR
jgi:DNA-binding response OmpR family regulator